jgi:hypothetical protein
MTALNYLAKNQWAAKLRTLSRQLQSCSFYMPEEGDFEEGTRERKNHDERNLANR